MLNMMDDKKRKEPMVELEDKLFDALKSGDKAMFKSILRSVIKEAILDHEMEGESGFGEDLDD